MGKAILAAIVTLIVGYLGTVVGLELLGNWGEFGLLIAIPVMGAFIIYFNDKKLDIFNFDGGFVYEKVQNGGLCHYYGYCCNRRILYWCHIG